MKPELQAALAVLALIAFFLVENWLIDWWRSSRGEERSGRSATGPTAKK